MYVSPLPPGAPLITLANIDRYRVLNAGGCSASGYREPDVEELEGCAAVEEFPSELAIPESDWPMWIERQDADESSLLHLADRAGPIWLNQSPSWYCWQYCNTAAAMLGRIAQGEEPIRLVPESVAGPIMNYRKQGGWPTKGAEFMSREGIADVTAWPWESHSQANNRRYYEGSRDNAARHRIKRWIRCRHFEQKASLLLRNIPVPDGYSHMGHAMCSAKLVRLRSGDYAIADLDSYARNGKYNTKVLERRLALGNDPIGIFEITPSEIQRS